MADTKISEMTAATTLASSVVPIVQGGANKKAADTLFLKNGVTNTASATTTIKDDTNGTYSLNIGIEDQGFDIIEMYAKTFSLNSYYSGSHSSRITMDVSGINLTTTDSYILLQLQGTTKLMITGLPTSASGLTSGMVWNDGGTLKIV
jgi:hypothetical protein